MLIEIKTAGKSKQRNLMKLVNFWLESDCRLIQYDYMENERLHDVLHEIKPSPFLDWKLRYKIAIGISQGLSYLHWDYKAIIHFNIKHKKKKKIFWTQKWSPTSKILELQGPWINSRPPQPPFG
ncbi:hypothetical protein KFK09_022644 [Dendrobium nobile]|uniref:Protein kinase domain-containing protein n=1 Tax=Dendrobium nobile TaxID=94219 RepID=A0A8T3AJT5_DENNO|nr:hypothetical protein KFK09_022644 [Dendrobium nobile]